MYLREHIPQIVLLCESRLQYRHKPSFPNFNLLRTDRHHPSQSITHPAGGAAMLVSNNSNSFFPRTSINHSRYYIHRLNRNQSNFVYIVSLYCSNQLFDPNDLSTIISFCENQFCSTGKSWSLVLKGDLNARHTFWFDSCHQFHH